MKAPGQLWECPKCGFLLEVLVPTTEPPTHYHERGHKVSTMVLVDKGSARRTRIRARGRGTTGGGGTSPSGRPTGGDTDPESQAQGAR